MSMSKERMRTPGLSLFMNNASLIDHVFTNNLSPDISKFQGILVTDITDHYPIFHIAQLPHKTNPDEQFYFKRKMTEENYEKFKKSIAEYDWNQIQRLHSCSLAFSEFHSVMTHFFNKAFPICKIKITFRNRIPWLSEPLKKMINLKNKLYIKYHKHDTLYNKTLYLDFKRSLRQAMFNDEKKNTTMI